MSIDEMSLQVDSKSAKWKQGDCVLGEQWFAFRFSPNHPITKVSTKTTEEFGGEVDIAENEVAGFVVLTQTCDIVRTCQKRPYLEVAPLVEVDDSTLREVQRLKRPQYVVIPGLASKCFVGDLDRVMTVEKAVLLDWERVPGCLSDKDVRDFAVALTRKITRFAFPDDFVGFVQPLSKKIQKKHSKQSEEGEALRALREIRLRASPSWDAQTVNVSFFFILDDDTPSPGKKSWDELCDTWMGLIPSSGRFTVSGETIILEEMTAKDYLESDRLDLDHLSSQST